MVNVTGSCPPPLTARHIYILLDATRTRTTLSNLRECTTEDWQLFTRRGLPFLDLDSIRNVVQNKRILITGAGGYIGSALAKALVVFSPAELVLLDLAELGLHQLQGDLRPDNRQPLTEFVVGSVLDSGLLRELFDGHRPQIIFHAAACKHVPLMERNPFIAAATNILGTESILRMAVANDAEQCIVLSTDKAVDPASIMGATKRMAELMVAAQTGRTETKALRLGNVLGSSGSVAPLFLKQIDRGGPVTVTHPDATRFFLSIEEAIQHLFATLVTHAPSSILIPDVGAPHPIRELATFMITQRAPAPQIEIDFIGLRPGDKLEERMTSSRETFTAISPNGLSLVREPGLPSHVLTRSLEDLHQAVNTRNLPLLLQALQAAVPEYRPSDLILRELTSRQEMDLK